MQNRFVPPFTVYFHGSASEPLEYPTLQSLWETDLIQPWLSAGKTEIYYGAGYDHDFSGYEKVSRPVRWHITDARGVQLSYSDFNENSVETRRYRKFWDNLWSFCGRKWSGTGPVPGTGSHKRGSSWRKPKTQQERRNAAFFKEEGEVGPRGRRKAKHLPTAWDDHYRSKSKERTWKHFRKTQYKTVYITLA